MAGFRDKMKGIYFQEEERVADAPVGSRDWFYSQVVEDEERAEREKLKSMPLGEIQTPKFEVDNDLAGEVKGVDAPNKYAMKIQTPKFRVDEDLSGRVVNPLLNGFDGSNGSNGSNDGSNGADVSNDGSNGAEPKKVKSLEELTGIMAPPYKEETAEEKAAREKRDAARIGWAGMLDGLNALSNLYYTTKGAPSQKFGNGALAPVMADINEKEKLRRVQEDKNREAVRERAKMIANAELERSLAEMKYQAAKEQEALEYENRKKLYELTHGHTMKEIEARGLNNVGLEGLRQEGRVNLEGIRQGGREALADKRAAAALERETVRQDAINARSGSGGSSKRTIVLDDGKEYDYNKSHEGHLLNIFDDLKDELKKARNPLGFSLDDKKTQIQKIAMLQEIVKNYPKYSERVREIVKPKSDDEYIIDYDSDDEDIIDY